MYNDKILSGIVIDAGHGGEDPGAINGTKREKDYNLEVSKYMYERFKELGIPVKLTRETDETLSHDERVKRVLSAFGNSENVVLLSNHINAGGVNGQNVTQMYNN
ncbi:MAG: N-acetylmuramoyl-L-alanine amidase [Bacilli bacterium]